MKDPIKLEIVDEDIDKLVVDTASAHVMDEQTFDVLRDEVAEFGFVRPVLARRRNRKIIDGHQLVRVGRQLGCKVVPVIYLDISGKKARLLALALNKLSGGWDQQLLAHLLTELSSDPSINLRISGFSEDEIARSIRQLQVQELRERPEVFDLDAAWQRAGSDVQVGDVFELGSHRLMCGDAADADSVGRLVGITRPSLLFTDPPYNVQYGRHGGAGGAGRGILNDGLSPEAFEELMRAFARNALAHVHGCLYICMSSKEWAVMSRILADAGAHWSTTIIWAKDSFVLGRADYHRQYEPIWYGWPEGSEHHWCGDRTQGDVWNIPRPAASPLHPTMKPLSLVERALENSSRDGDVVLDLFAGSGTTLIAAERTGRSCLAMELDPRYCSVILARWQAFTGGVVTKIAPDKGKRRAAR